MSWVKSSLVVKWCVNDALWTQELFDAVIVQCNATLIGGRKIWNSLSDPQQEFSEGSDIDSSQNLMSSETNQCLSTPISKT